MTDPRYPIGKFQPPTTVDDSDRVQLIRQIAGTPAAFRTALSGLSEQQLDTPYRDGGWTLRQVAHHLPDSHLNAYVRFKLTLTETHPTVKTYSEKDWAELVDAKTAPIDLSLNLLDSLHRRWVILLEAMTPTDFAKTFNHPESGTLRLDYLLALYAWHGRHHTAQITTLREGKGWR